MFIKKQHPPAIPWTNVPTKEKEKDKYSKSKVTVQLLFNISPRLVLSLSVCAVVAVWALVFLFWYPPMPKASSPANDNGRPVETTTIAPPSKPARTCELGFLVYVHELPAEFNLGLLDRCRHLNVYTDMCPHVANRGLGQPIASLGGSGSENSWFATHQFIAEMIFHARIESHPCRTRDPSRADLFYVPFYGGLDASSKFREGNLTERDGLAVKLVEYLTRQPWWRRRHGGDHFLALGRTAWDFMRVPRQQDFGANCLLNLPAVKNMSVLTVERQPWNGKNQHGIPYPSYFHPYTSSEMTTWQYEVTQLPRPHLFSFVGGPRKGLEKAAIRDELIKQCGESTRCELVVCKPESNKCHAPGDVLEVMKSSRFCLQAPGDSFTRRSTFDSILAGCIPVFFSPHTAYSQYRWFLPEDPAEYSVYLEENRNATNIEGELTKIPEDTVEKMRKRVVELIPRLTYSHPNATDSGFRDAVDVALAALRANQRGAM